MWKSEIVFGRDGHQYYVDDEPVIWLRYVHVKNIPLASGWRIDFPTSELEGGKSKEPEANEQAAKDEAVQLFKDQLLKQVLENCRLIQAVQEQESSW